MPEADLARVDDYAIQKDQFQNAIGNILEQFAYLIPSERFLYRRGESWAADEPVGKEGILHHLMALGLSPEQAAEVLKSKVYTKAHGIELLPGKQPIHKAKSGRIILNSWHPPELQPRPGEWPTIDRLLTWLTKGDETGMEWLVQWIAAKVQDPTYVPKVAVVLSGEPGSGKGTLGYIMKQMLGADNCADVGRGALESKFNARWIGKLFVFADEVISAENVKDISDALKVLIDGAEVEQEAKGQNQRAVRNRIAWLFASNDRVAPVRVDRSDRRYTVFSNHDKIDSEYRALLNSCFEKDRKTPTETFRREMQAFYADLLELEVDRALIRLPYQNDDREALIHANLRSEELFIQAVNDGHLEQLLEDLCDKDFGELRRSRSEWDFGEKGIATRQLYEAYRLFCSRTGKLPIADNKFGVAIRNQAAPWQHVRVTNAKGRQVPAYIVPRAPSPGPQALTSI
jgi:hypothetical protein